MQRHQIVPWLFVGLGLILLFFASVPTEYSYEDSSGNSLDPSNSVLIIDFVFPIVCAHLFLVGGYFMLRKKYTGVYLIWVGCITPALNEGISSILMGTYSSIPDSEFVGSYILIPLGFAVLAEYSFNKMQDVESQSLWCTLCGFYPQSHVYGIERLKGSQWVVFVPTLQYDPLQPLWFVQSGYMGVMR